MKIDNSQARTFQFCPDKYRERYRQTFPGTDIIGLEPKNKTTSFGTRFHQLLEARHRAMQMGTGENLPPYPPLEDAALELEAQAMLVAYEAHYPVEPFEIVAFEKYFELPIGGGHTYCGEMDAVVRSTATGRLQLLETKTERRNSRDNTPEAWASRAQVGLYLWAARQLYNEEFDSIILNICTRQSPAGREPASFRRDRLTRTEMQQREALNNLIYVADQIEALDFQTRTSWPRNRDNCVNVNGWKCDYFPIHVTEERPEQLIQLNYKPAEQYLNATEL